MNARAACDHPPALAPRPRPAYALRDATMADGRIVKAKSSRLRGIFISKICIRVMN